MCVCARACERACVCECVVCVRACVCVCVYCVRACLRLCERARARMTLCVYYVRHQVCFLQVVAEVGVGVSSIRNHA